MRTASALSFTMLASSIVATGAASLSDAADGWNTLLQSLARLSSNPCQEYQVIPGWGDDAVLGFALGALIFIGLTGWAMLGVRRWGTLTAFLAIVVTCALWLDAYAVSQAPSTDCDALGLGGAASAAIVRAGWCFLGASILCGIAWAWLARQWRGRDDGVALPAPPGQ